MAIYSGTLFGGFGGYVADAPRLGWRFAFDACGIFGMVYAIPLVFLLRDVPRDMRGRRVESRKVPVGELLTNLSFILLVLYFTLPAMAGWVMKDWLPAVLKTKFPISQGKAGITSTIYTQPASIIGALIGATIADRWHRTNRRGRIYVSAIGMCLLVVAIFGVGNAPTLSMVIGFLIVWGIGWGFFDANNMPILSMIARPQLRATGYGIMNMVSISIGGVADVGFGKLRDKKVPDNLIFSALAAAAIISIILVLLIRPDPRLTSPENQT
jgi:sugar phosphate permease